MSDWWKKMTFLLKTEVEKTNLWQNESKQIGQ